MADKFNPERGQNHNRPALPLTRAGGSTKPAHASIYLLADHLDWVLAACEDIVSAHLTWNRAQRASTLTIAAEKHAMRDTVEDIRKLENTVIMRVLKSRERAEEVASVDKRFRQLAKLYVAGTAVLVDAAAECGDSTIADFQTGDSVSAYLRSRGLIDPEAAAPDIGEATIVGEEFLIAKRIAAGPLMDLAASLLDALELHYDLFLDENELAMTPLVNRFEDTPDDTQSESIPRGDELSSLIADVKRDAHKRDDLTSKLWDRLSTAALAIPAAAQAVESTPSEGDITLRKSDRDMLSLTPEAGYTTSTDAQTAQDAHSPSEDEVIEDDIPTEIVAVVKHTESDSTEAAEASAQETVSDIIPAENDTSTATTAQVGDDPGDDESAQDHLATNVHVLKPASDASAIASDSETENTTAAADNSDDADGVKSETAAAVSDTEDDSAGLIITAANDDGYDTEDDDEDADSAPGSTAEAVIVNADDTKEAHSVAATGANEDTQDQSAAASTEAASSDVGKSNGDTESKKKSSLLDRLGKLT